MYFQLISEDIEEKDVYKALCSAERDYSEIFEVEERLIVSLGNGVFEAPMGAVNMLPSEISRHLFSRTLP